MRTRGHLMISLFLALALPFALAACGSSSDPAPGGGVYKIDVSAGSGYEGGGYNGNITIQTWGAPEGVKIYAAGAANASFNGAVPQVTANFGAEPLTIPADCTIKAYPAQTVPVDNNVYYLGWAPGSPVNTLWHKIDDTTFKAVTGLKVNAGATLTLGLNADENFNYDGGGLDTAQIVLKNDVEVLGTLRSAAFDCAVTQDTGFPADRGGLMVDVDGGIFIRKGGVVTTSGADNTGGNPNGGSAGNLTLMTGADGGGIQPNTMLGGNDPSLHRGLLINEGSIIASGGAAGSGGYGGNAATNLLTPNEDPHQTWNGEGIYLYSQGAIHNAGAIVANGGQGDSGGYAGKIRFDAGGFIYLTGTITANGGKGTVYNGRSGGRAWLTSFEGSVYNSGAVTLRGGDGGSVSGGGGEVYLAAEAYTDTKCDIRNSGAVAANGGVAGSGKAASANAGGGGAIYFWTGNGGIANSGDLSANGGDTNDNNSSNGGSGGYISLAAMNAARGWDDSPGNLEVSGNLTAKGGKGGFAGHTGGVYLNYWIAYNWQLSGGIFLYGYTDILGNGGNGTSTGHSATGFFLYNYSNEFNDAGPILLQPNFTFRGGNGDNAAGGSGGQVIAWIFPSGLSPADPRLFRTVTQSGTVTLTGGNGRTSGGHGGVNSLGSYYDDVRVDGRIIANGGENKTDNTYFGGRGGSAYYFSRLGNATINGRFEFDGGAGRSYGGRAGWLDAESNHTTTSGAIHAGGGASAFTAEGSGAVAGDGGFVFLSSSKSPTTAGATVTLPKGSGGDAKAEEPAVDGLYIVDGTVISSGGRFPSSYWAWYYD